MLVSDLTYDRRIIRGAWFFHLTDRMGAVTPPPRPQGSVTDKRSAAWTSVRSALGELNPPVTQQDPAEAQPRNESRSLEDLCMRVYSSQHKSPGAQE